MARGNGKQLLFHGDDDYQRMTDGLEKTVGRTSWEVFAFVWMPNHIHLFFRTPRPNLSKGMQYLLSGYANWYAKRHRRMGHLFQGRFKGELIEDESYFWTVSRYLHLNPQRTKRPLAKHPADWRWSSYRGYARRRDRLGFVAYDSTFEAMQSDYGVKDPARAYRRFVEAGVVDPPDNPFDAAWEGWLLGSKKFLNRIKAQFVDPKQPDQVRQARRLRSPSAADVISAVAAHFQVPISQYDQRRSSAAGRDLAAYLAHHYTTATLRELAPHFGLTHPDSVSNLTRRAAKQLEASNKQQKGIRVIIESL
jgi:putative transposase